MNRRGYAVVGLAGLVMGSAGVAGLLLAGGSSVAVSASAPGDGRVSIATAGVADPLAQLTNGESPATVVTTTVTNVGQQVNAALSGGSALANAALGAASGQAGDAVGTLGAGVKVAGQKGATETVSGATSFAADSLTNVGDQVSATINGVTTTVTKTVSDLTATIASSVDGITTSLNKAP